MLEDEFPHFSPAWGFQPGQAYEPQSVNDVMVHHAKDLVDQNNMQAPSQSSRRVESMGGGGSWSDL